MATAARASRDADVLGVISRHSSVDRATTPNAPIAREDDPELWAAIAASLDDQGGVEPPSPSQPCMQRHMSGVDPGIANKLRQKRAQVGEWECDSHEVSNLVNCLGAGGPKRMRLSAQAVWDSTPPQCTEIKPRMSLPWDSSESLGHPT